MLEALRGSPLSENIALLAKLCPVPVTATVNDPDSASEQFTGLRAYSLPFKYELQTAQAFSTLLTKRHHCDKVAALCIEERPDGTGLIIRTAVNYGIQNDRRDVLQRVSGILMDAPNESKCSSHKRSGH